MLSSDKFVALFLSDVHLQESAPRTTEAFIKFLQQQGRQTQQLYLLGDLFEYWAGDDDLNSPFNARIVAALRSLSDEGVALFWIAGNRDFLIGQCFAEAAKLTLLPDPSVIKVANKSIVIAHGDAQCTDDVDYQAFRSQVRMSAWQTAFLSKPLSERLAIIENMRKQSHAAQQEKTQQIMDVNLDAITELFNLTHADILIHGHTHRPASHEMRVKGNDVMRYVLTDWDFDNHSVRGGGIAIHDNGEIRLLPATIF